jgi:MFS family permease
MSKVRIFTRTIWLLGFVSLFNDISSEMLIPVMPLYLDSLGYTALWIGIVEGLAEAVVGLSKGYFGKLSDHSPRRLPFVITGYALSAVSKSMIALFSNIGWVLLSRSGDRLGKGIRVGARDAMLSDEASRENKGKVFGMHKAMDTAGAAIGPVIALVWLTFYPGEYRQLFFYAFIPSLIGVVLLFFVKEKHKEHASTKEPKGNFFSYFKYWNRAETEYKRLVTGLLVFTLFNSSDVFMLLLAKHAGISATGIIKAYIFYNIVYAILAYPMGHLADKIGMKTSFIIGLFFFTAVYSGLALFDITETMLYVIFVLYGIYSAATDGVSKAWISKVCNKNEAGTALGFYASASSLCTMLASTLAGVLWVSFFPEFTFLVTAIAAFVVALYFIFIVKEDRS